MCGRYPEAAAARPSGADPPRLCDGCPLPARTVGKRAAAQFHTRQKMQSGLEGFPFAIVPSAWQRGGVRLHGVPSHGSAFHLEVDEIAIEPRLVRELRVGALLDDAPFVENDDAVGATDGRKPVGDHEYGALAAE